MTSYNNFSQTSRSIKDFSVYNTDNPLSYDPKKRETINIEAWRKFISYYRHHIDEFAVDILKINLYPFQRLILRSMARHKESMFIASRGLGKSYLSAVFFICVAILYKGIKLGIASGKGQQARNVIIQKIKGELFKNENVAREIVNIKTNSDDCVVHFKNGSEVRAIVIGHDGESARSWRFHQLLIDEARLVKDSIMEEILVPMTKTKRQTMIDLSMKYGNDLPVEKGKIIYISSAYLKNCSLYDRFTNHYNKMLEGKKDYFVCTLPYQVGVNAGIYYEDDIMQEKNKPSMTRDKFAYEYEAVFVGNSNESFFPYDLTDSCRIMERAEIKQPKKSKVSYVISHDVALSEAYGSDNASTVVIKLKEKPNGNYNKELVYIKTNNGMSLPDQANFLRELLLKFPNTIKLVLDVRGNGQPLPSLLDESWEYKNDQGETVEYPPLVPDDDDERKQLKGAIPLIRKVAATNNFNNVMYTYLKASLENKSLKLLVNSAEVDFLYKSGEISQEEYSSFINTDFLINELSNIKQAETAHGNTVYERISKSTKRDRVTSLAYAMAFISELEQKNKLNTGIAYDEDDDLVYF
ncbi:hypothetical protein LCM23_06220 [Cytobacillus kochii]|uniref:hypothetical protein n=1 Tax=Cytobacillus kochii TaxID=859143 RepID=UPI001CD34E65|nr:hypothetical protein [Cytobacillus kochii]MCA1025680.1 hypothetical protein [Cytobacillus kochii]